MLGGAQGVLNIPRPAIGELQLDDPVDLYFVALGAEIELRFVSLYDRRLQR